MIFYFWALLIGTFWGYVFFSRVLKQIQVVKGCFLVFLYGGFMLLFFFLDSGFRKKVLCFFSFPGFVIFPRFCRVLYWLSRVL